MDVETRMGRREDWDANDASNSDLSAIVGGVIRPSATKLSSHIVELER